MKKSLVIGISILIVVLIVSLGLYFFMPNESSIINSAKNGENNSGEPVSVGLECIENQDCSKEFKCVNSECISVGCVGDGENTPGAIGPEYSDHMATECCEGLKGLIWNVDIKGCEEPMVGGGYLCTSKCGNEICDSNENKCICPEDCVEEECVGEGGSIVIYPEQPNCCEGLTRISCDGPINDTCEVKCDGSSICAKCGNGECGAGENKCNCPADCS